MLYSFQKQQKTEVLSHIQIRYKVLLLFLVLEGKYYASQNKVYQK